MWGLEEPREEARSAYTAAIESARVLKISTHPCEFSCVG